jgi:ArsR family transcriptional regulator, lead/cadmium/zinc/bismuth-responsive transcriptional repressor
MIPVDDDRIAQLADVFHLMGEPNRLRMVLACLDDAVSVGAMATRLGLSASLVSQHLRLLKAARLLSSQRRGKQVFYRAADHHVRSMLHNMVDHVSEPENGGAD